MEEFEYQTPSLVFISEDLVQEEGSEPIDTFFEDNRLENFRTYQEDRICSEDVWYSAEYQESSIRKSMSITCLANIKNDLKANLKANKYDMASHLAKLKLHHQKDEHKNARGGLTKEHLNELAKPKRYNSVDNLASQMTMAESVQRFHKSTPQRFRSKPTALVNPRLQNLTTTVPQSPKFMTKTRSRSTTVMSAAEREALEVEEMKKYKIKAAPLNKKILEGPVCPKMPVCKKPATVQKPFNITDLRKSTAVAKIDKHGAKGKPEPMKTIKPTRTKLEPFSFDVETKQILKRREQLLNRVFEEEKKAREFHARPPPKCIYKSPMKVNKVHGSMDSVKSTESTTQNKFKATKPTVLYKKPFEPVRPGKSTEIVEFALSTDKRAKERQEFEEMKREKEVMLMMEREKFEEERRMAEEREKQEIRKQTVIKARPMPEYKKFEIMPSTKPLTDVMSPKFHYRSVGNKENIQNNH